MRRYAAIKSNGYAPASTNVIQQHMLHCHMTYHYRMMYNAKSKVDSSPPRHYKGRSFPLPDCSRKKLNKHAVRSNRTKATHRPEIDLQKQLLIDRILYDTKLPPSAYLDECVTQRQYMLHEPTETELQHTAIYRVNSKDLCQCQNIDGIPSLNISSNKARQVPQFRDFVNQPWTKKLASANKQNSSVIKQLENPKDVVRNNISRQISKPRLYHSSQPRRTLFQGETVCVSSGSEGNAGDDEDGAPTSSYDDSSPSENEKSKQLGRKVTAPGSTSLLKKTVGKRVGDACFCIPALEEAKKVPVSEVSSRDSAYGGGEGMSSTEKERTSPDQVGDRTRQFMGCVHCGNGSKAEDMSFSLPQEEPQFCFKSELYMKFLQDVTDDILVQGAYSNEVLERLFQEHINNNVYNLDVNHLKLMIEKLAEDLGMPINHCRVDELFDKVTTNRPNLSVEKRRNTEKIWPITSKNFSSKVNVVVGNHLNQKSEKENGVSEGLSPWAKKQFPLGKLKSSSSVVIIEQNFSMSKKDILDNLADLDFDKCMAEEIYHILAGKGGTYPDFTLKELQEIIQQ